jgi:hypothetical protein
MRKGRAINKNKYRKTLKEHKTILKSNQKSLCKLKQYYNWDMNSIYVGYNVCDPTGRHTTVCSILKTSNTDLQILPTRELFVKTSIL